MEQKYKTQSFSLLPRELNYLADIRQKFCCRSLSAALSMVLALAQQNSTTLPTLPTQAAGIQVPNLPGMTENIVRSHLIRWELSQAEYNLIVDELLGSGEHLRNPEAAIFGACRKYVCGGRSRATKQPSASSESCNNIANIQDQMY